MLHILHGADLHLDAPFTGLSAEQARTRRAELRELPGRLADLAREREADLLLLSGDLFDGADPYAETAQTLDGAGAGAPHVHPPPHYVFPGPHPNAPPPKPRPRAGGQAGCPVFIAPGNHDPYGPRSPYALLPWPENVHIFQSAALEPIPMPKLGCTLWGAAFTSPSREDSPLSGFSVPAGDGGVHIGVLHADVAGKGRYAPLPEEDIAASGLTYLALGHVHACSGLRRAGDVFWAYPGCPEGRGFDELGEKGCLWVTVEDGGGVEAEFLPLAKRRYRLVEADLSQAESPQAALLSALPDDAQNDILRVVLTGESDLDGVDLVPLKALAGERCWSADLRDHTTVRRDLWSRAEEDTLTGLFLRQMRLRLDQAEEEDERERLEEAVRFGLAALEHREEPMA